MGVGSVEEDMVDHVVEEKWMCRRVMGRGVISWVAKSHGCQKESNGGQKESTGKPHFLLEGRDDMHALYVVQTCMPSTLYR